MADDILTQLQKDIAFRLRLQAQVSNLYEIHHPHMIRVKTIYEEAAEEIERLRAELHDIAEHLGNALYSDEWRTREYAIVAFGRYERAHPGHERDVDEMVDQ